MRATVRADRLNATDTLKAQMKADRWFGPIFGRNGVGHHGYWWFLNSGRFWLPNMPEDTFYHIGNGDPKRATCLLIAPQLDLVAVLSMTRLSEEASGTSFRTVAFRRTRVRVRGRRRSPT